MSVNVPRTLSKKSILFFSLIMLAKSYFAWYYLFEDGPTWTTWLKEIPCVLLVFCLIEWFATKRKIAIYMLVNLLISVLFFSLIVYHNHFGIIATSQVLDQVKQVGAVKKSIFSVLRPEYMLIFLDIVIISLIMFSRKKAQDWKASMSRPSNRKLVAALFCVSVVICTVNIFPNRASMNETIKAEQMGILNYEAYSLLTDQGEEPIERSEITQSAIDDLKGIHAPDQPNMFGAAKGKNLIILQMESFQNFLIHLSIDGQEITPNMNRLADSSFYFPRFYQQVGQGNTSDAEFMVNTSFYVPQDGAATQMYAPKELPSLPKLLQAQGYDTATFHTNNVEFWNRGELYDALGFDRYYDKANFFGEEDTFFYGPSDEVLYEKTASELARLDQSEQPFYSHVISMSAHNPFSIPEDKYKMTLPERYEGTLVGDYIRAQNYADYALGLFIDELKANGVWDNSVIVLYGDHRGLPIFSLEEDDKALLEEIFGHEYSERELINIPLLISSTGVTTSSVKEQIGGQVDILPTVCNLLGVPLDNHLHFGQDLLNHTAYNLLPERYYLPTGSFVNNEELFLSGSGFEDGQHLPLNGVDVNEANPVKSTEDEFNRALELLQLSDSYVTQLPDRVVEDTE